MVACPQRRSPSLLLGAYLHQPGWAGGPSSCRRTLALCRNASRDGIQTGLNLAVARRWRRSASPLQSSHSPVSGSSFRCFSAGPPPKGCYSSSLSVIVAVVTVVPEQGDATAGHSAPRTVGRLHVSRNQPLAPPARAIRPTPQVSAAGRWVVPRIPTSERDQKTGVWGRQWSRLKQARAV